MRKSLFSLGAMVLVAGLVGTFALAGDKEAKNGNAAVGQPAPLFSLQDQDGKSVNLGDYKDKIVVLEWWNDQCPVCAGQYHSGAMQKTANELIGKGVTWLAINSTKGNENAKNKEVAGEWKMSFPILNDASGDIGHMYGAKTTPHMFVINKGIVAYNGAIDNQQKGDKLVNYVTKAVDEIMDGKSVSEPMTKPYGCSVKYAH